MHSYFVRGLCRRNAGIDEWVMRPKTQQLWSQDGYQRQAKLQRKRRRLIDKRPVERETNRLQSQHSPIREMHLRFRKAQRHDGPERPDHNASE